MKLVVANHAHRLCCFSKQYFPFSSTMQMLPNLRAQMQKCSKTVPIAVVTSVWSGANVEVLECGSIHTHTPTTDK
jgi:hypothetical protein